VGTAGIQGTLWGARPRDWAEIQEPTWLPIYEAILDKMDVGAGTRLLDVGCGAGAALVAAQRRGADVTGLDAATTLVAIARERLPASRIEVGEMEELPFGDQTFDVVTSFNAFQFAGDLRGALREAGRVCRPGGRVAMLVWGLKDDCDLSRAVFPEIMALVPPPPPQPAAAAGPPLAAPGTIEMHLEAVGLRIVASDHVDCEFVYPSPATAWRALASAGGIVRVIQQVGEDRVRSAVISTLAPFTRGDNAVVLRNRFRWVAGTPQLNL
jgi:SAM-dependent methyltransferase